MGIPVISVDGQIVRQIRTYVLRCFSCMKSVNAVRRWCTEFVTFLLPCRITRDTTRRFCATCGNDSLRRLTVSIDESGKTCYHLAKNKRIATRGTKVWLSWRCVCMSYGPFVQYSLPLPKGGRNSDVHILKEDQAVTWKPPRTRKMPTVHALDPDFLALSSPFAAHDVSSRGAQIVFAKGGRNGRTRNPNETRKKGKRKT